MFRCFDCVTDGCCVECARCSSSRSTFTVSKMTSYLSVEFSPLFGVSPSTLEMAEFNVRDTTRQHNITT
jgi:hypothetical protein